MRRIGLIAVIIAFGFGFAYSQSSKAEQIDKVIKPFVKAGHFAGVVLAAEDGRIIYEKGFGLANADYGIPNRPDTRIGIASITKPMTSVILIRLVEAKKISYEAKLNEFIPDFPNGEKITIEMLARHRSGIPHRVMPPELETVPYTSEEMVRKIKEAKLEFEPGTGNLYSSAGYSVLARVLEIASGKTYSKLLQEYVFGPAGMKESLDFEGVSIMERRANDYLLDSGGIYNAPLKDYSFLIGAGSVFSTAGDIFNFGRAMTAGIYGETARSNFVRNDQFSGNGSTNGHRAFVKFDTRQNYAYVLLSNLNAGSNDLILAALEAILEGKKMDPPKVPNPKIVSNPNKNIVEFLGRYESSPGRGFELKVINGVFYAGDLKLEPVSPDCFFDFKFYGDVCFIRDEDGKITHINWASPGFTSRWVRK